MDKRILKYFDKNDELKCGVCDWWGSPGNLIFDEDLGVPVCPRCGIEDVFDITKNIGRLL